jgi:hypothetical protein
MCKVIHITRKSVCAQEITGVDTNCATVASGSASTRFITARLIEAISADNLEKCKPNYPSR